MGVFLTCLAIALVLIALLVWPRRPGPLLPESLTVVSFDDVEIRIASRDEQQRVLWTAIDRIVIRTTDVGPFVPDVFWELHSAAEPPAVFSHGATGEPAIIEEFQRRLPGFRNDEFLEAMKSTSNREFVVWVRES